MADLDPLKGITLEIALEQLSGWLAANTATSNAQEYWINGRRVTKADAAVILKQINYWQDWVNRLSPSRRPRARYVGSNR